MAQEEEEKYTVQSFLDKAARLQPRNAWLQRLREVLPGKLVAGAVKGKKIKELSLIQKRLFHSMFFDEESSRHSNFLVQASTGLGKTFAFVLSGLMLIDPNSKTQQMVIIAPIMALVRQPMTDYIEPMLHSAEKGARITAPDGGDIKILFAVRDLKEFEIHSAGGMIERLNSPGMTPEEFTRRCLECQIVVSTPSGYKKHIRDGFSVIGGRNILTKAHVSLGNLKMLIFDEADEVLISMRRFNRQSKTEDDDILEWHEDIIRKLPRDCKIQLHSATFDDEGTKRRVAFFLNRTNGRFGGKTPLTTFYDGLKDEGNLAKKCSSFINTGQPSFWSGGVDLKGRGVEENFWNVQAEVLLHKIIQLNIKPALFGKSKTEMNRLIHRCFQPKKSIVFIESKRQIKDQTEYRNGENPNYCRFIEETAIKQNKFFASIRRLGNIGQTENAGGDDADEEAEMNRTMRLFQTKSSEPDSLHTVFATKLLARGFDLPDLELICNFDLPISYDLKTDKDIDASDVELENGELVFSPYYQDNELFESLERGWIFTTPATDAGNNLNDKKVFILDEVKAGSGGRRWSIRIITVDAGKFVSLGNKGEIPPDFKINKSIGVYCVYDFTSYKYRIGRTGRYQTSGLVVNLIDNPVEEFMYEHFHDKLREGREAFLNDEVTKGSITEDDKRAYLAANPKIMKTIDDLIAENKTGGHHAWASDASKFLMIGCEKDESGNNYDNPSKAAFKEGDLCLKYVYEDVYSLQKELAAWRAGDGARGGAHVTQGKKWSCWEWNGSALVEKKTPGSSSDDTPLREYYTRSRSNNLEIFSGESLPARDGASAAGGGKTGGGAKAPASYHDATASTYDLLVIASKIYKLYAELKELSKLTPITPISEYVIIDKDGKNVSEAAAISYIMAAAKAFEVGKCDTPKLSDVAVLARLGCLKALLEPKVATISTRDPVSEIAKVSPRPIPSRVVAVIAEDISLRLGEPVVGRNKSQVIQYIAMAAKALGITGAAYTTPVLKGEAILEELISLQVQMNTVAKKISLKENSTLMAILKEAADCFFVTKENEEMFVGGLMLESEDGWAKHNLQAIDDTF